MFSWFERELYTASVGGDCSGVQIEATSPGLFFGLRMVGGVLSEFIEELESDSIMGEFIVGVESEGGVDCCIMTVTGAKDSRICGAGRV